MSASHISDPPIEAASNSRPSDAFWQIGQPSGSMNDSFGPLCGDNAGDVLRFLEQMGYTGAFEMEDPTAWMSTDPVDPYEERANTGP